MDTTVYPSIAAIAEKFKNELHSVQPQAPENPIPEPSDGKGPPPPPPADVIVENTELEPLSIAETQFDPAPPPPTVIGYV